MTFKVGDTVVYPHHGAALIEAVEIRVIKGAEKEYLVLRVAQGDLTVRVPADNVDLVGVRDVVNAEGLDRVFEVLRQPYTEEPISRSLPPETSSRWRRSCATSGAASASAACPPVRSACSPRLDRFS
jgi:RNA polymerase-interacting CarD/CdnL/TRCF family regulator